MSTAREGYLRDLPHPNLNDVLKSNTYSAIKLLKTGKLTHYILASLHVHVKRQIFALLFWLHVF